jgi:hypothetical protein
MLYQSLSIDHISDVMASILASSAVDHGFKLWSGKTKSYKIGNSKGSDSGYYVRVKQHVHMLTIVSVS